MRKQTLVKLEYLKTHPCVDCGFSNTTVLQFDHVRGLKRMGISEMIRNRLTIKDIEEEITKCEVRCSNCHRLKHSHRSEKFGNKGRQAILRNRDFVLHYLSANPCIDCGFANPVALDFDHIGPKHYKISRLVTNHCSLQAIQEEIAKCEVRCSNCHMIRHFGK